MTFAQKISIILKDNTLGIATMEDLSEKAGFHRDTIRKAIDRNSQLNKGNTRIFTDKIGISRQWWETGKGPVFNEKPTHEQVEPAIAGNPLGEHSRTLKILQDALAEGSDYRIIPKTILDGEYRIFPKSEIEQRMKELEARAKDLEDIRRERMETLDAKNKLIKRLEDEVAELRAGKPVAAQSAK